jgi:predicted P-loop ATPase
VGIERDRDQLWAEAVVIEAGGEPLYIPEDLWEAAAIVQRSRNELDLWAEKIAGWIENAQGRYNKVLDGKFSRSSGQWKISTAWIAAGILEIPIDRQGDATSKRIVSVMESLGWTRPDTTIRIGSSVCRGFVKDGG